MSLFIVTFIVIALVISGMAIGVMLGKQPIKGSCGGMSALGMKTACDVCGGNQSKCDEENERVAALADTELAYDASESNK